jgi:membrane-associated phospholipid phosphatase
MLATPAAAADDPVLEWNAVAAQLTVVPALTPVQQTRVMAIVHVAVHDAVNGITGAYHTYKPAGSPPAGISAEAAAIGAAHRALIGIFGDSDLLATRYASSLAAHGIAPSDSGLAYGASVADAILALRQNDGAAAAAYVFIPSGAGAPGVWTPISSAPTAQSLLPGWGSVTPFVLRSGSQFRPEGPPALDSDRYAKDFNEVAAVGAAASTVRTGEQTQIAFFWRASPTAIWNPILRKAIESRSLDLSASARAAALFYLAASDASVACWEAKYVYNFWRPQPAIANADLDGNPATGADPSWRPLVPTPPHPEFPSGHGANSGAMGFVLKELFGDAPGFEIEATSSQAPGVVRRWQTFSEGVREVVDARVYSGIHFRTADEVGARLGRQVAQFVLTHALRPVRRR